MSAHIDKAVRAAIDQIELPDSEDVVDINAAYETSMSCIRDRKKLKELMKNTKQQYLETLSNTETMGNGGNMEGLNRDMKKLASEVGPTVRSNVSSATRGMNMSSLSRERDMMEKLNKAGVRASKKIVKGLMVTRLGKIKQVDISCIMSAEYREQFKLHMQCVGNIKSKTDGSYIIVYCETEQKIKPKVKTIFDKKWPNIGIDIKSQFIVYSPYIPEMDKSFFD